MIRRNALIFRGFRALCALEREVFIVFDGFVNVRKFVAIPIKVGYGACGELFVYVFVPLTFSFGGVHGAAGHGAGRTRGWWCF